MRVLLLCLALATRLFAENATLDLRFTPRWDGAPLLVDSLRYSLRDETVSVTRLSALLGGFALERARDRELPAHARQLGLEVRPRDARGRRTECG